MPRARVLTAVTVCTLLLGGVGSVTARADAPAADLYVKGIDSCSPTGPGTLSVPFCTVQEAAAVVEPGQTVHIGDVGGVSNVVLTRSGTANAPITFTGIPQGSISQDLSVPSGSVTDPAMFIISGAQYVHLEHMTLHPSTMAAISLANAQHISLNDITVNGDNNVSTHASTPADAVDIDGASSDVTLTQARLAGMAGSAVSVSAGASHVVVGSAALSVTGPGIRADGVKDLEVAGDTVSETGGGIVITGASTGSVENTVVMPRSGVVDLGAAFSVSAQAAPGITEDYNSVTAKDASVDYSWSGTSYTSSAAFHAATGQGEHDLDSVSGPYPVPTEGSALIDSGDANAPGESATDYMGRPQVDDPKVANTGTGSGSTDRGAIEFQDPFGLAPVSVSIARGPAPLTVTAGSQVQQSPWGTQATGYSVDFGDGSAPVAAPDLTATHTYTTPGQEPYLLTVTATLPDGTTRTATNAVAINTPGPLTSEVWGSPVGNYTANVFVQSHSPWSISAVRLDFGDGSPAVNATAAEGTSVGHTFPAAGTYTVTATVTDAGGQSTKATGQIAVGAQLVAIAPERVLDTRNGTGATKHPVGPGGLVRLKITGVGGVPATGVSAVTMNVTDTHATAGGYVTVYADGKPRPNTSNLNFLAGQSNPNEVTVPVGADGYVDLWNAAGNVDLVADLQGYFVATDAENSKGLFTPVGPTRVLDTRNGTGAPAEPLSANSTTTLTLPANVVPAGATAVVMNVTATRPTTGGFITVFPRASGLPTASNLNFQAGQTTSNLVVIPLDSANQVKLYNFAGRTDLIADVQGYYGNHLGSPYIPTSPTRLLDTRNGTGATKQRLGSNTSLRVKATGTHGIPNGTTAVVVNLTGTGPTGSTYLTAYGSGPLPTASNINLNTGQTRPVQAIVPVDANGYITIHNAYGTIDVIADLQGYYGP